MPLVVNVGLNRKASRDYQSTGFSINLSAELDSGLINDAGRLQAEIAKIYAQARVALENQVQATTGTVTGVRGGEGQGLAHSKEPGATHTGQGPVTVTEDSSVTEFSRSSPAENRHRQQSRESVSSPSTVLAGSRNGSFGGPVRPATESQLKALKAICRRMDLDLAKEIQSEFGLHGVGDLDVRQASALIGILKERQTMSIQQRRWA